MRRRFALIPPFLVSFLIVLENPPAISGQSVWTLSGLRGQVSELAIARSNPDILYAYQHEEKAVLKSTDAGRNWIRVLSGIEAGSLSVHPSNPDIVLASSNALLLRSSDGGTTWVKEDLPCEVFGIQIHPANPDIIDLLGWDCIYRSVDGGTNWRNITPGICFT